MRLRFASALLVAVSTSVWAATSFDESLAQGKVHLEQGNPSAALENLLAATVAEPQHHEPYFYLAVASYRLGNYTAAGEYAGLALEKAPKESRPQIEEMLAVIKDRLEFTRLKEEGDAALGNGLNAKAADAFAKAYRKFPNEGEVGLQAASILADRLDRLLEAAAIWNLVSKSEDAASADVAGQELSNRHLVLEALYQKHSAQFEELKKSGKVNVLLTLAEAFPTKAELQREIASFYATKGDVSRVVDHLQGASRLGMNAASVVERPEFIRLLGVPGSQQFLKFIEDAFGTSAVGAVRASFKATGLPAAENIANIQRFLLSGSFNLTMSDEAINQLIQTRIQEFKTDSPFIAHFKATQTAPWQYFNIGFVFPVQRRSTEHQVLDSTDLFGDYIWEEVPVFMEKTDGPVLKAFVDHLSQAGLKPFLGFGENWKLVQAITENGVYSLSFATILKGAVGSHLDAIKKLKETFGPMQPFASAPSGFLEYGKDAALAGGRFLFPQANGVTLDGRIFKSREYLVEAPWILELRVSKMHPETALFHQHHEVNAQTYFFGRFSKVYAEERVNLALQESNGLKFSHEGHDYTLQLQRPPFTFYAEKDNGASYIIEGKSLQGGKSIRFAYSDIDFSKVSEVVPPGETASGYAKVWKLRFSAEIPREIHIVDEAGEESSNSDQVSEIPFYHADAAEVIGAVVLAALQPVSKVTADDVERIANVFNDLRYDGEIARYLEEADAQGKLRNLAALVGRLDSDSRVPYLLRAAKAGDVSAMGELREFYENRWRSTGGTDKEREQMVYWGVRAADGGDRDSLEAMIEWVGGDDYLAAERWLKALQAKGAWDDPEEATSILRRAELVRKLKPLGFQERVKAFVSDLDDSVIGQRFKSYATAEKQFTEQEKYKSDYSGAKVTVYKRGQAVTDGPQMVWVNRKGVIIGEYYLLGGRYTHHHVFDEQLAYLRQTIGPENIEDTTATASNLKKAYSVRYNSFKTIALLKFEGQSYLKIIDHSLE